MGFEPTTSGLEVRRANPLRYGDTRNVESIIMFTTHAYISLSTFLLTMAERMWNDEDYGTGVASYLVKLKKKQI